MRRTPIAAALSMLMLAAAVASAGALEATMSPGGSREAVARRVTFEGGGATVTCSMTLTLSLLTGPISIRAGQQLGEVTAARAGECEGGTVEEILELPFRITVNSMLPATPEARNLTGSLLNVLNASWRETSLGGLLICLYRGTAGALMPLTATARGESRYTANHLEFLSGATIPLYLGIVCSPTHVVAGTFSFQTATYVFR
jgi:hypothetical protein